MSSQVPAEVRATLDQLPPSTVFRVGTAYSILELRDQRAEARETFAEAAPQEFDLLDRTARVGTSVQLYFLLWLAAALRAGAWLFRKAKLLSDTAVKNVQRIESGLESGVSRIERREAAGERETADERDAREVVEQFKRLLASIEIENSGGNGRVKAYLLAISSGALAYGQRRAHVEDAYRKIRNRGDRDDAAFRSNFMVTALGIGTLILIRNLLALLVIGMSIPWLIHYFVRAQPDFTLLRNIAWGAITTILLWILVIGSRVFFNNRRMMRIKRATEIRLLEAEKTRAEELAKLVELSWLEISAAYQAASGEEPDAEVKRLVLFWAEEYAREAKRKRAEIERFTRRVTFKQRIARLVDVGSQGEGTDLAAEVLSGL